MNVLKRFFSNPVVKTIGKILSWIILIILVLLASLLIYYVASSKIYQMNGQKSEPAISLYTIISPSMEPNINVYDVVITKKVDANSVQEGDIITFISTSTLGEGLTITHRVKSVINTEEGPKFRTQGDNNPIPDAALVTQSNLLGKVILRIPYLGYIQFLLQSRSGWLFVLLVPAIIVVLYDIIKVIKLSSVKQKINESFNNKEEEKLREKQENLKKNLSKKFINIKNIDPMVDTIDEVEEEKLVLPKKKK